MRVRFVKPDSKPGERMPAMDVALPAGPAPAPAVAYPEVPVVPQRTAARAQPRRRSRWRWPVVLLLVSSPLLYFAFQLTYTSAVVEAPGFLRLQQVSLYSTISGRVRALYVKPSQRVSVKQPIARVGTHTVRSPIAGRVVDLPVVKGDEVIAGSKLGIIAPADGELEVAAYVPRSHADYAATGQAATVIFPDGSEREAEIVEVPEPTHRAPISKQIGSEKLGLLVQMKFVTPQGEAADARQLTDGLPVRVRFRDAESGSFRTTLERAWNGMRERVREWRAVAQSRG